LIDQIKFYGAATVGTKGQIVIPAEAREELNIKEGDKMIIVRSFNGEGVMVLKSEMVEQILSRMQTEFSSLASSIENSKGAK
jgi:AbrB family looped-hinge helix DNA binding protein